LNDFVGGGFLVVKTEMISNSDHLGDTRKQLETFCFTFGIRTASSPRLLVHCTPPDVLPVAQS